MAVVTAVGLAVLWYVIGGWPGDHDRYGSVPVPGQDVVSLPDGDIRLYHENSAFHSGDSTHLADQPPGLAVRVAPAAGGGEIKVEDVSSWLFSSTSGNRGHEPYGRIDVPSEGDYRVQTTADSTDGSAEITVGAKPWNPLGSKLLGALLAGLLAGSAMLLFALPFRFIRS